MHVGSRGVTRGFMRKKLHLERSRGVRCSQNWSVAYLLSEYESYCSKSNHPSFTIWTHTSYITLVQLLFVLYPFNFLLFFASIYFFEFNALMIACNMKITSYHFCCIKYVLLYFHKYETQGTANVCFRLLHAHRKIFFFFFFLNFFNMLVFSLRWSVCALIVLFLVSCHLVVIFIIF